MLSAFLLALREGLEAALLVGIVLGALRRLQRADCTRAVWSGVLSAVAVSGLAALLLHLLGWTFEGRAEPIFEGVILFGAAGLLTWMIFWMRRQAAHLRTELESGVRAALALPGRRGVFVLTFVAVAREGVELAVFLAAATVDADPAQTMAGAACGLAAAAFAGWLMFATTVRLDLRPVFNVTGVLLIFFAAGLVAKGVHEFNEVGWIPPWIDSVWDTRAFLNERSVPGTIARSLFGYTGTPSLTAVLAYVAYLGGVAAGLRRLSRSLARAARQATPPAPPRPPHSSPAKDPRLPRSATAARRAAETRLR
jgi:high-affinity iron transporter